MATDAELRAHVDAMKEELGPHYEDVRQKLEHIADLVVKLHPEANNRAGAMLGGVIGILCANYGIAEVRALVHFFAKDEQYWRLQTQTLSGPPPGRPPQHH